MNLKDKIQSFYFPSNKISEECYSVLRGSTYGQFKYEGVENLISEFKEYFDKPNAIFYDLGCGPGHLVFHIALATNVEKAYGVEFEPKRFKLAEDNLKDNPDIKNVEFILEDFTKIDLSNATIVYIDNAVIENSVAQKVFDNLPTGCLVISVRTIDKLNSKRTKKHMFRNYTSLPVYYTIKVN